MKFMALGGTNEVGANCYYVEIGCNHFLLDCGCTIKNGMMYGPNFSTLFRESSLLSLSELDAILISHAHYDHVGYLPTLSAQCKNTPIFTTTITKSLFTYLMLDRVQYTIYHNNFVKLAEDLRVEETVNRITTYGYQQSFMYNGVKITFFEAGHVPGAAMISLVSESTNESLLYTGDFMKKDTSLTKRYSLPPALAPQCVIMCALHAKHPNYIPYDSLEYADTLNKINCYIEKQHPFLLVVTQLTKGIEVINKIFKKMETGKIKTAKIFIDDSIWELSSRLGQLNIKTLTSNCYRIPTNAHKLEPGIYVGGKPLAKRFQYAIDIPFSLHSHYMDCFELLKNLQPPMTFIVHSPDSNRGPRDNTILAYDLPRLSICYPEAAKMYTTEK